MQQVSHNNQPKTKIFKNTLPLRVASTEWKYATNTTDFNKRRMREQQSLATKFECISWKRAAQFDSNKIPDRSAKRQLNRIVRQGRCGLGDEKYTEVYIKRFLKTL